MDALSEVDGLKSDDIESKLLPKKFINAFCKKIKTCQNKSVESKTHKKQIQKLISKVKENRFYETIERVDEQQKKEIQVNKHVINRLQTENFIKKFELEQTKKIDDFGKDVDFVYKKIPINPHEYYFKLKMDRIKSNSQEIRYQTHFEHYCDSINLIGHLARTLPKLSDPPEQIWQKLLRPIKEIE